MMPIVKTYISTRFYIQFITYICRKKNCYNWSNCAVITPVRLASLTHFTASMPGPRHAHAGTASPARKLSVITSLMTGGSVPSWCRTPCWLLIIWSTFTPGCMSCGNPPLPHPYIYIHTPVFLSLADLIWRYDGLGMCTRSCLVWLGHSM